MGILEGILYMIWRGIAIGVIISAPMGPVGILCVQRTLEKGRRTGFYTGLGAAISDLFYCLLTGFGLSFIEDFLKANQNTIQIVGSLVLVVFGVYLFRSNPARTLKKPDKGRESPGRDVLSGFLFTFSNPLIIFLIIGLFARFNFLLPEIAIGHYAVGFLFIFAGALMWWWMVTYFVDKVRSHFNLRSMWLINKITGGIIMIFAVVGIVTAITGMASASTRTPRCYNSTRGFGPLSADSVPGRPLALVADDPDTAFIVLPIDSRDFTLTLRVADISAGHPSKSRYTDRDGKTRTADRTAWGIKAGDVSFTLAPLHDPHDDLTISRIDITAIRGGETSRTEVRDGVDFADGVNTCRLRCAGDMMTLSLGNRRLEPAMTVAAPACDTVAIFALPGCRLEIDCITLQPEGADLGRMRSRHSHFGIPDVRQTYFMRSTDDMEGIWEIFDRQLEDDALRLGGNYRLAMVGDGNDRGYELIYIDGAVKNADIWEAGMTKCRLLATSFGGVYDVEWLDPSGEPLPGEIKAQVTGAGMITLQFPDHGGSTLRLKKVKDESR